MRRDNPKDVGAMLLLGVFIALILFLLQKCGIMPTK